MTNDKQKQKYLAELKDQVENHPKSYLSYINQTGGELHRRPNRQYLRDFISEQTPLLSDDIYSMATKLYWIFNNITSWEDPRVCCEQCGKPFIGTNVHNVFKGYHRFCSRKCQYSSNAIQEQIRQTCLKRYGVENAYKIPHVIEDLKERKQEIQQKREETKRRNHSFNESNIEKQVYDYLKNLYPDLIFQYSLDNRYPFNCDFYSPINDLFIEYNGSWTHGGKFYNPSNEDCQKQLNEWKEKSKKSLFFVNAIETWTIRDVAKRNIAEKNHLNYIVFWSIHEVAKYLNEHGIFIDFTPKKGRNPVSIQYAMELCKQHSEKSLEKYRTYEFPYPQLLDNQIDWEIDALSNKIISDKQFSPIIRKYHRSIWNCSKEKQMSPVEYWAYFKGISKEKWEKFYINRIVHAGIGVLDDNGNLKPDAIRYGFEVLHYSDCVSYLKPFLAKRLIQTYLSEYSTIFCPMNGFSGFLLGSTLGCGKKYIGQDLNSRQIAEAQNISNFLFSNEKISKDQVSLVVKDIFNDYGTYDCLVCCPPYNLKEKWNFDSEGNCLDKDLSCNDWMKVVLTHYECKKYLFVVDDSPTDFDDKIVEKIKNRSHFGTNFEKVIVI